MEIGKSMLQMLEFILARQEKAHAEAAARQEKMNAELKAAILTSFRGSTPRQTETTSCPKEMDATRLEYTLEETEAAVERQKLRENEINVDNIASSEGRSGHKPLAVRRRQEAKKRSQDSVGSRQKSSAARKRVIHRTVPAVRKGYMRKGPGKDRTKRRGPKGWRLENIRRRG
jgi:hypothetical protein